MKRSWKFFQETNRCSSTNDIQYNILRKAKIAVPNQTRADDFMPFPTENMINLAENIADAWQRSLKIRDKFKNYFNEPVI